jgi:outer membrane immunogenic protein
MKKILLATTALVAAAVAVPAGAADMRPALKAPPPIVRPACAQFGGFYIGGHIGWGNYEWSHNDVDAFAHHQGDSELPVAFTTSKDGWLAGIAGGYNFQTGCSLWGVEIDWSWADLKARKFHTDGWGDRSTQLLAVSKLNGIGTLRTRLGVVVDNVLLYVTGGFAVANFKRSIFAGDITSPDPSDFLSYSKTRWGGVVGVGAEWAFSPNVSIKTEFLYAKFAKHNSGELVAGTSTTTFRFESNDSVLISRVGINFRFGGFGIGKGPVAARF